MSSAFARKQPVFTIKVCGLKRFVPAAVFVLDDAAGQHVRESESFRENFFAAALFDDLFEGLAFEIHHGAVGADGTRAHAFDIAGILEKRNLDVGLVRSFLGEYFYAHVFADRGAVSVREFLVHGAFAVKDHGMRAGAGGIISQGQVGGRDGQSIVAGGRTGRSDGGAAKQKEHKRSGANESLGSIHGEALSRVETRKGSPDAVMPRAVAPRALGPSSQAVT